MSSSTSTGQYLTGPRTFEVKGSPLHTPGPGDVVIAPRSTTLCGSDIHYFQHARNGTIVVREPLCLGHESAGVIVAVGSDVVDRQVGDRVAVEPGVACGQCELCQDGRYNLCPNLRFRGSGSAWPHYQGSLQSRMIHPAKWTHKLSEGLSFEEGALLEPLAVAVHACRRAGIKKGSTCIIIGAGAVGLLCAVAARLEGCSRVAIADIAETRVDFAVENDFADAGFVVPLKRSDDPLQRLGFAKELATSIGNVEDREGVRIGRADYTFECTGVESCVQASIYATKSGGKAILVGMGTPNHFLPISEASAREVDLVPTWRYADCYPRAMEIMQRSKSEDTMPSISTIVTHRFEGLERVPSALETACRTQDDKGAMIVKVVVNFKE